VLTQGAGANIIQQDIVRTQNQRGEAGLVSLATGQVQGTFMGMSITQDYWLSDPSTAHTRGTISSLNPVVNAAVAKGVTTAVFSRATLTGTLVAGDLFSVVGDDQTYVVSALATAGANTITVTFDPPVQAAAGWALNAVVTIQDSYSFSLVMHPHALATCTRPPMDIATESGYMQVATDPLTGITLGIEIVRQNAQTAMYIRVLGGSVSPRPQLACKILQPAATT